MNISIDTIGNRTGDLPACGAVFNQIQRRVYCVRNVAAHCDARGEVKGKLANGVGSQHFHTASEPSVSSITTADAHTSAASSRLN